MALILHAKVNLPATGSSTQPVKTVLKWLWRGFCQQFVSIVKWGYRIWKTCIKQAGRLWWNVFFFFFPEQNSRKCKIQAFGIYLCIRCINFEHDIYSMCLSQVSQHYGRSIVRKQRLWCSIHLAKNVNSIKRFLKKVKVKKKSSHPEELFPVWVGDSCA